MSCHISRHGRRLLYYSIQNYSVNRLYNPRWNGNILCVTSRNQSSIAQPKDVNTSNKIIVHESSFKPTNNLFKKFLYKLGLHDANKYALKRATIFHYQACTDKLDFELYFEKFKLPDTLFSFFLVVQLHVWMCQARSMLEGPEGRLLRNELLARMWQDIDLRLQNYEIYNFKERIAIMNDLLYHNQAAILSYDEGLLADDKTLANALWRTLYAKSDVEAATLEYAVKYVRKQMDHLKLIGPRDWCLDGKFDWGPIPE